MNPTGKRLLCLGAASVVIVLAGCSSSKSTSSSPTSAAGSPATTASSSASATGAPIKVGLVCSCSGPYGATLLPAEQAYKAWVNTVNASGGLEGHPIQLTTKDDTSNPSVSTTDAQTLIADRVDAIVDVSVVGQPWASAVQASGIPVVGSNNTESMYYTNPDFFPSGGTINAAFYAVASVAKAAGVTKLGALYCAESVECEEIVAPLTDSGKQLGVPVVFHSQVAATAPNYTAQCVAAQQQHVDGVFIGDSPTVIARIGQDCSNQGYNPAYVIEGEAFSNVLLSAPGLKNNLWAEFGGIPFWANVPGVQAMNAALDKYYPGVRENPNTWTGQGPNAWASGLLLADAVKASGLTPSGTPSPAEIGQGLYALKGDTLQGMSPPLTFTKDQPHPVSCWFTARVTNGTPSLADNGQVTCQTGSSS